MAFTLCYLGLCRILGLCRSSRRTETDKDIEIMVLRHQVLILEREGCTNSSPPHSTSRVPTKVPMGELDGQRAEPS